MEKCWRTLVSASLFGSSAELRRHEQIPPGHDQYQLDDDNDDLFISNLPSLPGRVDGGLDCLVPDVIGSGNPLWMRF